MISQAQHEITSGALYQLIDVIKQFNVQFSLVVAHRNMLHAWSNLSIPYSIGLIRLYVIYNKLLSHGTISQKNGWKRQ